MTFKKWKKKHFTFYALNFMKNSIMLVLQKSIVTQHYYVSVN